MIKLRKGFYDTTYGNTCTVSGPNAKTANDLDMGERIPLCEVDYMTWRRNLGTMLRQDGRIVSEPSVKLAPNGAYVVV